MTHDPQHKTFIEPIENYFGLVLRAGFSITKHTLFLYSSAHTRKHNTFPSLPFLVRTNKPFIIIITKNRNNTLDFYATVTLPNSSMISNSNDPLFFQFPSVCVCECPPLDVLRENIIIVGTNGLDTAQIIIMSDRQF